MKSSDMFLYKDGKASPASSMPALAGYLEVREMPIFN